MRNAAGELPVTQQRLRQLPAVTGRKQREAAVTRNKRRHNKECLGMPSQGPCILHTRETAVKGTPAGSRSSPMEDSLRW